MWLVAIAWIYTTVTMALAEAISPQGTALGAIITLLLYGVAPLALTMYLMDTPRRRRARKAQEASAQSDASGLPASDPIATEREIP